MTYLVAEEEYLKVLLNAKLKADADGVFERQGTSQREGVTRLLRWFIHQPPELQALVLAQVPGQGAAELAKAVLKRFGGPHPRRKGVVRNAVNPLPQPTVPS